MLGKMVKSEYSFQPCIVEEFQIDKQLWKVQLADPIFEGRSLTVKEKCLSFAWYAAPSKCWTVLPSFLRVSPTSIGNALFCDKYVDEGVEILEEHPVLVVSNKTGLAARWKLYQESRLSGEYGAVQTAFEEFTDGGVTHAYMEDAQILMKVSDDCQGVGPEAVSRLAGALARWQSNSLNVSINFSDSQSALYRFACKANHSCEPNCVTVFDMDTGCMILRTRRRVQRGEQLTINYMGADPDFAVSSARARRMILSKRDFVCCCSRCVREGGEEQQSCLAQYQAELARDLERQRKKAEEKRKRKEEKDKEKRKARQSSKQGSRRSSSRKGRRILSL